MNKLTKYAGIGDKLAEKLAPKLDMNKPIARQLKKKDIFKTLPLATQADLKYKPCKKIPREIIQSISDELKKRIPSAEIAGSFRRGKPYSRDIDIILIGNTQIDEVAKIINDNNKVFRIVHIFAKGPVKCSVIIEYLHSPENQTTKPAKTIKAKGDIFITSANEYKPMLLFATGSGNFNIIMRAVAKKKGYLLNQHGLYKDNKKINWKSEEELFKLLGMTWRVPSERV